MIDVKKIIAKLAKYGITYKVSDQFNGWRVFFVGGDPEIRNKFQQNIMREDKGLEIQALLVLERAKEKPDLMYEIEERAAIREFDAGTPCTLLETILAMYDTFTPKKREKR